MRKERSSGKSEIHTRCPRAFAAAHQKIFLDGPSDKLNMRTERHFQFLQENVNGQDDRKVSAAEKTSQ